MIITHVWSIFFSFIYKNVIKISERNILSATAFRGRIKSRKAALHKRIIYQNRDLCMKFMLPFLFQFNTNLNF
jgi:hypothetical protein